MSEERHTIKWCDSGREPQCPPDPRFPKGIYIAAAAGVKHCAVDVPYPAVRCGVYIIECLVCKVKVGVTAAGRPDDPRRIDVPCREILQ